MLAALVRGLLLAQGPLIEPDVPAYVRDATRVAERGWRHGLTSYYPPLLPMLMASVHGATGLDHETAGRAVSFAAGLVAVGLTGILAAAVLGTRVGIAAALLAAVHAYLVRASITVLPEMLFGALVALWGVLLFTAGGTARVTVAAIVAAAAGTARLEGLALVPLTIVAAATVVPPGRRARAVALVVAVTAAIVGPWLLLVRAATDSWAVSGKDVAIVARRWDIEGVGLFEALVRYPGVVLGDYPAHLARQIGYAGSVVLPVLVPLLAVGLLAPLAPHPRRVRRLSVLTLVVFTLGVATINPGKRYVTPLLPLVLPWIALGAVAVADRIRQRRAAWTGWLRIAAAAGIGALAVHAAIPDERRWAECFPEVCVWLEARHGRPLPPIMVRDGRLAYLCDAPYVHEPRRRPAKAIAPLALEKGVATWLIKASRRPTETPPGFREVTTLCRGRTRLVVYEPRRAPR